MLIAQQALERNTGARGLRSIMVSTFTSFSNKLLASSVCTEFACSKWLKQVWNKLLTACDKLDGTISLFTRFSQ